MKSGAFFGEKREGRRLFFWGFFFGKRMFFEVFGRKKTVVDLRILGLVLFLRTFQTDFWGFVGIEGTFLFGMATSAPPQSTDFTGFGLFAELTFRLQCLFREVQNCMSQRIKGSPTSKKLPLILLFLPKLAPVSGITPS